MTTLYLCSSDLEARKKWTNLRDYFHRMNRYLCREDGESRIIPKKKWFLYNSLSFLVPHLKNYKRVDKPIDPEEEYTAGYQFEFDDCLSQTSSIPLSDTNRDRTIVSTAIQSEEPEEEIADGKSFSHFDREGKSVDSIGPHVKRLAANENFDNEEDEDELFLRSLIPKMKLMTMHHKMEYQAGMIMLILKHFKLSEKSSLSLGAAAQGTN